MTIPEYDEPHRPTLEDKREELLRWALVGNEVGVVPVTLQDLASRIRQAMTLYRKFPMPEHPQERERE